MRVFSALMYCSEDCPTCGSPVHSHNTVTTCKCCGRVTCECCNPQDHVCDICVGKGFLNGREVMFL